MIEFKPGFRLSIIDIFTVVIGTAGAAFCYKISLALSLIIIFVVGHFFLFCNVTRMSRIPELIWAAIFLLLAGSTLQIGSPGWVITFTVSGLLTIVLVFLETKKPSYHGILWEKFNPNLLDWFNKHGNKST